MNLHEFIYALKDPSGWFFICGMGLVFTFFMKWVEKRGENNAIKFQTDCENSLEHHEIKANGNG